MARTKKQDNRCITCGDKPSRSGYKYCSNSCQFVKQREIYIERWKKGEIKGLSKMGLVSTPIKKYLREKFGNKCCMCGWSQVNPKTGKVPLVADHIDGNWRNNTEENLRLVCPNCDALSPTYAGANKGNSGRYRVKSKRAIEAQSVVLKERL